MSLIQGLIVDEFDSMIIVVLNYTEQIETILYNVFMLFAYSFLFLLENFNEKYNSLHHFLQVAFV